MGFSDVADPEQPDQAKITISDAHEDEEMLVVISVQSGKVDAPNHARLKLKLRELRKICGSPGSRLQFR